MSVNGNPLLPGVIAFLVQGNGEVLRVENLSGGVAAVQGWQLPESILALFPSIFVHSLNDALTYSQKGAATHLRDMPFKIGGRTELVDVHIWPANGNQKEENTLMWMGIVDKRCQQDACIQALVHRVLNDAEGTQQETAHSALVDTTGHTILLSAGASFLAPWVRVRQSVALDREFEVIGARASAPLSLSQTMREASEAGPCPVLQLHRRGVPDETWTLAYAPVRVQGEPCGYACRLTLLRPQPQPIHGHIDFTQVINALEQACQRLGHDIREPLDAILGYVNLLLLSPDPRVQPALIREAVDLASQRIRLALDEALTWRAAQAPVSGWVPPLDVDRNDQP